MEKSSRCMMGGVWKSRDISMLQVLHDHDERNKLDKTRRYMDNGEQRIIKLVHFVRVHPAF